MSREGPAMPEPAAPGPVSLIITHDPISGRVDISGPLQNRLLCYGMLESAKEALFRMGMQQGVTGGKIVVPRFGM